MSAGILTAARAPAPLTFAVSAVALALLAATIGFAVEQLGRRLSAGVTGILQSALGNLPELFIGIFALRAGLVTVVQTALVGSILANSLLVLGLALFAGGVRNGRQKFAAEEPRAIGVLIVIAVAALIVPTLAVRLHTPAGAHAGALSVASAVILLALFAASVVFSLRAGAANECEHDRAETWPAALTFAALGTASVASAFVSDWFVASLSPTIATLHVSQAFTGLVIVAIAGNAVENVVGVTMAIKNKTDYAVSIILNSSLQVAVGLIPVLVLLSFVLGGPHLTLVMPALLVVAVGLAAVVGLCVVFDGESNWLEGAALVGLYGIIAAAFWWG